MKMSNGSLVDFNTSSTQIGEQYRDVLTRHALTGCDSTSYPFGKGKLTGLKLLPRFDLQGFGDLQYQKEHVLNIGKHFYCLLYGS